MDTTIDLIAFIGLNREVQGQLPITDFTRLSEGLPKQTSFEQVQWSLKGYRKPHGPALLLLGVKASPQLMCQRCLELFHYDIDSKVELEVVTSEKALDADVSVSGEIDNQAYEKILATQAVNILALVEDELILSLPYIPKHAICPTRVVLPEDNLEKKPSPFAVLEKLKP